MEQKQKTVTITLTESCNLKCSYCYEHNKSSRVMSLSTAKQIIDYELSHSEGYNGLEFDLFGGEPFLAFNLIKEITEYLCQTSGTTNYTIFLTTNGTLVHGEIQDWLRAHRNCVVCGLSLDGTREMHNINRSNSYDDIDLDFFLELYSDQDVKMTISQETLPDLAQGVIDMHNKGFIVSCNLAYEIDWSNPSNTKILHRELVKLTDFYLNHPEITPCSMLEMGISNVAYFSDKKYRYCGAGIDMRAYDVDGNSYPCQFFMPLSVGEDKAREAKNIHFFDEEIPQHLIDDKCKKCIIQSVCPNCYGANYAATGNIYRHDDNMCRLTKIIIKARSYFKAKQWERGQLHESPEELDILLKAILTIQQELEI